MFKMVEAAASSPQWGQNNGGNGWLRFHGPLMYLGWLRSCWAQCSQPHQPTGFHPQVAFDKEVLRPYITSDNFLILVKRVKDLGFFLGTFICHSVSEGKKNGFNLIRKVFHQFFVKPEYILSNVSCGNQVLALVNKCTYLQCSNFTSILFCKYWGSAKMSCKGSQCKYFQALKTILHLF